MNKTLESLQARLKKDNITKPNDITLCDNFNYNWWDSPFDLQEFSQEKIILSSINITPSLPNPCYVVDTKETNTTASTFIQRGVNKLNTFFLTTTPPPFVHFALSPSKLFKLRPLKKSCQRDETNIC
jgi:hypothetical protein